MAPAVDRFSVGESMEIGSVVMAVAMLVGLIVIMMICGCGGKKKEDDAKPEGDAPGGGDGTAEGKGGESSAKNTPESGAGGAASDAKGAAAQAKSVKPADATQGPKGGGPEMKRAPVPTGNAVPESHDAYQTLMKVSQFDATAKPGAKGAQAKVDQVAGNNPAYVTIMNTSKFDPSTKPEPKAASSKPATTSVVAATAMAGPTDKQTMMKTAVQAASTTKK